ncbi:SDR family NAD(P)-dependent oxidoreductase [Streptomyces sp. LP05-1]|uniref:SDR family NAD(P)-dependent oxidoreductase n=1 Tax=Streptomyces pyxinae TaxID=2970734 RepID=A0ABT2CPS4_9ACTN|nr:SDR family NAD(P)-dependent oxidoreductase [Streptomyces sp. LP05-1]MCS0639443.1 SDR family NAD(P)-dependent oxidoreductase [Streptomyces sp. LP05-1]
MTAAPSADATATGPATATDPASGPATGQASGGGPVAVVTGASSGIGAATARQLAAAGHRVVLTARRADRIEALAAELTEAGRRATAYPLDVTDRAAVDAFAATLDRCDLLVNNAGGALGADPVATGDPEDWRRMYEVNVLGTLHLTQALLPALTASGAGTVVVVSSTAAHASYEGGAGYVAAKNGARVLAETLRLEIVGTPVRVIEIAPGMVRTEEFATTRFRGDTEKAAKVYAGVAEPLTADDVADTITWAVTRPAHVNIDLLVVRPRAQASNSKVHREL